MSSNDEQYILDSLLSLPTTFIETSIALVDALERNIDEFALQIRDNLSSSTWIPRPVRPSPAPQPIPEPSFLPIAPECFPAWARHVIADNLALVAAVAAFAGTGGVVLWRRRKAMKKRRRRARRALNGLRKDAVVVTGAVNGTLSRVILPDLERKGFVVYVAISNGEEEADVKRYANERIIALRLDVSDPASTEAAVAQFAQSLKRPSSSPSLHLAGLVVIPSVASSGSSAISSGKPPWLDMESNVPIEQLEPSLLSDALNTSVLYPITMIKALLGPLKVHSSRIVLLTPSISPSLAPSQTLAATISGALDGFSAALAADLQLLDVPVVQMKLGKFDFGQAEAEMLQQQLVPYGTRMASSTASSSSSSMTSGGVEGSSLKELNDAIFDALMAQSTHSGIWRVGKGSWIYAAVERLAPWGSMRWRLGLTAVRIMHS